MGLKKHITDLCNLNVYLCMYSRQKNPLLSLLRSSSPTKSKGVLDT